MLHGQYGGRAGMVTELDEILGVCVHLGHVDPHCCHVFEPTDLQVVK